MTTEGSTPGGGAHAAANKQISACVPLVIRGLAARRQLRQSDLATAASLSQSQLSKIMRGLREPTLSQLEAIAAELGTTIPALWADAEEEAHRCHE